MPNESLIELQPRYKTEYISENRTVLITDREGWITGDSDQGLWIYQARTLSRYRWLVNGKPPQLSAFSPVNQNSSIGYYIAAPRNWKQTETKDSNPAQQSIELRVGRAVGDGLHEDVWLTNHTQINTVVDLALEIAPDFESPAICAVAKTLQAKSDENGGALARKDGNCTSITRHGTGINIRAIRESLISIAESACVLNAN
jgi:N-terminal domain of (some) glycogen debranching enzymes